MNKMLFLLTRFAVCSSLAATCYAQNQRAPLPNWSVYDAAQGGPVVRVQPQIRYSPVDNPTLTTLAPQAIEPFLIDAWIVDKSTLDTAARIVGGPENRVLLGTGDLVYARGNLGAVQSFRILRQASPIKDPTTQAVLGYETLTIGTAELISSPDTQASTTPHVLKILSTRQEIRRGDSLVPASTDTLRSYTPHPGPATLQGHIVSIHGGAVRHATENQIVVLDRGTQDGVEVGQVFGIFQTSLPQRPDKKDADQTVLQPPDVQQGTVMVFRAFDKLSYALVLKTTDSVKVGDRFAYAAVNAL